MVKKLNDLWWKAIPAFACRFSRITGVMSADGVYLIAFQKFSAFTPLFALIMGLVCGVVRFGATDVFSQSMIILILAVVFGLFSTLHGVLFVLGYAVIDFFLPSHTYLGYSGLTGVFPLHIALLVTYLAMVLLAAGIPFLTKLFRTTTLIPFIHSSDVKLLLEAVFGGVVYAGLLFIYIQALPLLIRPPFTWSGGTPNVEAAYQVQHYPWIFVGIALIGGFLRVIIEAIASAYDVITIDMYMEPIETAIEKGGFFDNLPSLVTIFIMAGFGTYLFSGLFTNIFSAIIIFLALVAFGILRQQFANHLPAWPALMERIPVLFRLIIGLGIIYLLANPYMNQFYGGTSFIALIWGAIGATAIMTVFFPPVQKNTLPKPKKIIYHEEYL